MKKILFLIIFLISFISGVKAENVTLVREDYDNTYAYYYDSSQGKTRYVEASKYMFGSTAAYCLELGRKITSFDYTFTNSFEGINIAKDDLDYIKLVSYYGYNYPGHDTDRFYMATQELIWKRLVRTSIKFTIGFNPDKFYNLTNEETVITVFVNRHNIKPSFDSSTIDIVKGEETVIEDSNEVLYLYYSDDENVVIDNNKLIIKSDFDKDKIVLKRHNYTEKEFFLYTSGNSQKMMSSGGITNATSNININLLSGSIELNKYDNETKKDTPQGEATLNGATYGLYDENNNLIDTFIIGKKNKITALKMGTYYIKELEASEGYLLDDNIYSVDIDNNNQEIKLAVYEDVIKRKVEIFKVYASDNTEILEGENNIKFNIYNKDNVLVDSIITDNLGYASIYLPYGSYIFKQMNSTKDYYKVDTFSVTIDNNDERPIVKLISNSKIKAKVRVIKKDLDTKENIINGKAKFKIYDVDNDKYLSFKVNYPNEEEIDTFEINKDGTFTTPYELEPGNYILYEVDTDMNGYLYNKEGVSFVVGENMTAVKEEDELVVEINFYNKRVKGILNIIKYGEKINYDKDNYYYDNILLDDVVFNLYADEDIYENNKLIYNKDNLVGVCITSRGECNLDNIPLGSYYLKEISSNLDNNVDSTTYKINFSYKNQYTKNIVYNLEVNNHLSKGKLTINKYEKESKKTISNTLIEIRNKENKVVYKGYTNENGQIILEDMMYGQYYLAEIESKTGYRLLEDKINFTIDKENTTIDIYNERIEVPNTGIGFNYKDILVIFYLITSIIIMLSKKNKYLLILGLFITTISILYFVIKFHNYYNDKKNNETAVEAVLNKKIDNITNEKYRYKAVLEIPSIKLKRGILDINNKYNKAKYNIELVKEEENLIVLASHNGNNYNSYFGSLTKMALGDTIDYYYNNKIYRYIYTENYEIKKNSTADIYRKDNEKALVLITCKDSSDDGQVVFIGYLSEILEY